ncbi:MAG: ABC-2 family transporter protein [Lachnospiraceae bacterium]
MKVFRGKHWTLYISYLKEYLRYPVTVFFKLIELPIQMLLYLFLWKYIAREAAFDLEYMIFYYFITGLLGLAYPFVHIAADIEEDILEGTIFNYLVRPYHYILPKLSKYMASMSIYAIIFIPSILLIWMSKKTSADAIFLFVICWLVGTLVEFFTWYTIGLLAMSQERIRGFIRIIAAFKSIVSGSLFPLALMPVLARKVFMLMPFQCYIYAPANILLEGYSVAEAGLVILKSVIWLVLLIALSQGLYSRGLSKLKGSMA